MTERPSAAVLQVFILRNGELLGTDMFNSSKVVVGRDPTVADLVLESSQVSRRHAVLEHDGAKVTVRDLGSTNGVFVNGRKVESASVSRLDDLGLGDFSLKVKLVGAKPVEAEDEPTAAQSPPPPPKSIEITRSDLPAAPKKRSKKDEGERPAPKKREEPRSPFGMGGVASSDLSEWDDVPSADRRAVEEERLPRAEFRHGGEIDKQRLGRMLEDIGIAGGGRAAKPAARLEPLAPTPGPRPAAARFDDGGLERASDDEAWAAGPSLFVDEEEEEAYEPPYSLVEQLLHEDVSVTRDERDGHSVVEVLTLTGDRIESARLLRPGDSLWVGPKIGFLRRLRARDLPPRVRLLKVRRRDVRIEVHKQMTGSLQRGAHKVPVEPTTGQAQRRRGTYLMNMRHGEVLDIVDGPRSYHVRFVSPPAQVKDPRPLAKQVLPERRLMLALGGSFAFHLFVILVWTILRIIWPAPSFEPPKAAEEFVDVTLDTPKLE
ncbi:MAG: FHA domain-containing protein, partial [Deltaproteobacteria bacterium]|nr:FHA domain-containing protein [Deltaproteobacteria bacterium]